MPSRILFVIGVTLSLLTGTASAQDADSIGLRFIELRTNWSQAVVEVDGEAVGTAHRNYFVVGTDAESIRLVPPSGGAWAIRPVESRLSSIAGDSIVVDLSFPYYYKFESAPYGAKVIVQDGATSQAIGTTPFLYQSAQPLESDVEFRLAGFVPEMVDPGAEIWNRYLVELQPIDATEAAGEALWAAPDRRRWWIDAAALTSAAAAGALAIHYKFKADNRFDEYQVTGNPDLRPDIERLDTYSGVALGVMQAGIGLFAIRLVLR